MQQGPQSYDHVVLAGDVGGTNVNLALMGLEDGRWVLLFDRHYKTKEESSIGAPLRRFLAEAGQIMPGLKPSRACVSGAGPLSGGRIRLTNAAWTLDERELESAAGIPSRLINDFTALSYGVLCLDHDSGLGLTRLSRPDAHCPAALPGGLKLVIGAGTGLGVGYIVTVGDRAEVLSSEGGHIGLPVFDEESARFQRWLGEGYDFAPGAEAGISGQGIGNIFLFLTQEASASGRPLSEKARLVLEAGAEERPALIAASAREDELCAKTMEFFVKLYARAASDLCAAFLPYGGLYLAGGITAKNEALLSMDNRFMRMFEKSYAAHIRDILRAIPVAIVNDYSISLYGAARAALAGC